MIHLSHIPSNRIPSDHIPWNDNFVRSESGVVLVEFSLALLPLLALLLLCVDVAWSIFARATLQDLSPVTGAGGPAGGNVVEVSITGISIASFGPLWRSGTPVPLFAMAADVMESSPNGINPCP